jgi:nucleotide-binding universal stress UspA family protein
MAWAPKKCVVVPYDFSSEARGALDTALELAESPACVRVVYAMQDLAPLEMNELWPAVDEQVRREHALKAMREKLCDARFANVPMEVLYGDPGHAVTQFASDVKAELIVLPSHGRTGIGRLLIGSVAERIVRYAHCPVLVLRK